MALAPTSRIALVNARRDDTSTDNVLSLDSSQWYHPLLMRRRSYGVPSQVRVRKFVQYSVTDAPDGVSVAKFVQYGITSAPDAVSVSKFVQYIIVEEMFTNRLKKFNRLNNREENNDADESTYRRHRRLRRMGGVMAVPQPQVFIIT